MGPIPAAVAVRKNIAAVEVQVKGVVAAVRRRGPVGAVEADIVHERIPTAAIAIAGSGKAHGTGFFHCLPSYLVS